ncbi:MAG: hypothetical protein JWN17_113 [Frankiales bacterium]|nr:hypothetical protein [Frankiales bacterium]
MPAGSYALAGGTVEEFRCAAGPRGWRYVGTRPGWTLDLTVDAAWRPVRLLVVAGGVELRGGAVGPELVWRRGEVEHAAEAVGFTGDSPAFAVVTARQLRLDVGGTARLRLVRLSPALGALTVDEGWGRTPDVEEAERYEVADLASGERREVHLVGDVVVAATGVELASLTPA